MIGGLVLLSLTLVWWGGALFAFHSYGWAFTVTALGAGWLGIIYGALGRSAQARTHADSNAPTT